MPTKLVVGYDFSEHGELALEEALRRASVAPGCVLHVLMALEEKHKALFPDIEIDYEGAGKVQSWLSETVHGRVQQVQPEGLSLFVHVRIGDPASEILGLAAEADADCIIVGTHGYTGVKRWLVGSVAEKVVREAHCGVIVARAKDHNVTFVPSPEPPCPKCVETRQQTDGGQWWCETHAKPYVPPHRYSYRQEIAEMQPDDQPLW
ncbi:MAG TPA: universal stress protein [Haliangium sp.]|nr:universal stress protein [Haliangium sp.]